MKNVLITGGAGFIGSNFIRYVRSRHKKYKIVNLDLLTYAGNLENLQDINFNNYTFVKGDIGDRELVENLFKIHQFDYVINFAAESHVDRSIQDPDLFIKTNVLGTQVLLDVAKKSWEIGKDKDKRPIMRIGCRFVQISTDEVYGSLGKEGMFDEETNIAPNSPYASSKASADLLVRAYHKTYGLPTLITRCSNNYGPYQYPEKLIPLMVTRALKDEKLPIYGDGMQIRDWLHVSDHCAAIDTVLHKGVTGEVYNIGGHNERCNIEIVRLILKELGKSEALIEYVDDRLGHDKRYAIDSQKITRELGWIPRISFEEGIMETIIWYSDNKKWHQNILKKEKNILKLA
jgi:dTDP-glucose 4,6-dehydratase